MPRLPGIPVLLYHGVTSGPLGPGMPARERKYWLDAARLAEQLAHIRQIGYGVSLLGEPWGQPDGECQGKPVVLTFDDGQASDYETTFPLLAEAGVRAEFFVNTADLGRPGYLTWSRMAEMQRAGMSFQSHSHEHVDLTRLDAHGLDRQLGESRARLEDGLGQPVRFLAPPFGRVNRRVVEVAVSQGYRAVCTSRPWPARLDATTVDRIAVFRATPRWVLRGFLAGRLLPYLMRAGRAAALSLPKRLVLSLRPHPAEIGVVRGAA